MNHYFKADADLIGQLIEKDSLRYTQNNVAILVTVFSVPGKNNTQQLIRVVLKGEDAEVIDKQSLDQFYLVRGELSSEPAGDNDSNLPEISLIAKTMVAVPNVSIGIISCRVIGRLTKAPTLITKTNDFEFSRFSLAVNLPGKAKPLFIDFSVFKPQLIARLQEEVGKGDSVYCEGEMAFYFVGESKTPSYSIKLEKILPFMKGSK